MSRETLLDEAIAKAKEVEDWQLVEWLRMARGSESAARWYTAKLSEARLDISKLMTENAKLQEEIEAAKHDLQVFSMSSVQLDAENAKLRELVRDMVDYGEGAGNGMAEWFADRMRELGVEVRNG